MEKMGFGWILFDFSKGLVGISEIQMIFKRYSDGFWCVECCLLWLHLTGPPHPQPETKPPRWRWTVYFDKFLRVAGWIRLHLSGCRWILHLQQQKRQCDQQQVNCGQFLNIHRANSYVQL